jgi:hypothetical protein
MFLEIFVASLLCSTVHSLIMTFAIFVRIGADEAANLRGIFAVSLICVCVRACARVCVCMCKYTIMYDTNVGH